MTEAALHRALGPLETLVGTWRGEGKGQYPSIDDFDYSEELSFWHTGRPWLGFLQRTWSPESGAPMHSESGYWRPQADGRLEVVIAHAFGIVEVLEGTITRSTVDLVSKELRSTTSAKQVTALTRTYEIADGTLAYSVSMAYGDHPLQHHLGARLNKEP